VLVYIVVIAVFCIVLVYPVNVIVVLFSVLVDTVNVIVVLYYHVIVCIVYVIM